MKEDARITRSAKKRELETSSFSSSSSSTSTAKPSKPKPLGVDEVVAGTKLIEEVTTPQD